MIRILVVDDEPYIVEGLVGLIEEAEWPDLEVRSALSSRQALEWLGRTKVDIVLSDIHMPGMNGLELQKRILQLWPRCKVVFLTGHNEFEYAKEALRNGAAGYILKTDGDEAILGTLRQTIDSVLEHSARESYLADAQLQMRSALPLLQKEYLLELLRTPAASPQSLADQLGKLKVPLSGEEPVLLAQARVMNWKEELSAADRTLMLYAIRNIADEYWQPGSELISFSYDAGRIVWLLQIRQDEADDSPEGREAAWERLKSYAFGNLESIQASCRELLRLSVSFAMAAGQTAWEKLPDQAESLDLMFHRSFGMGDELLLRESAGEENELQAVKGPVVRASVNKVATLAALLEGGKQRELERALRDYMLDASLLEGPEPVRITVYYQLVAMFMNDMLRSELYPVLGGRLDLSRLTRYDAHASWEERLAYLTSLIDMIFEVRLSGQQRQNDELVSKLKQYIDTHISGDISLTRLGEVAAFNASYLSRIFKQYSGINLTEYIMQARINEAKRLLRETGLQVQEITKAVGFESAAYFIRLFKKETNLTPQQYREMNI